MKITRMVHTVLLPTLILILASVASAHPGPLGHRHGGFAAGVYHPFSGIDHVLAMIAVGLLAAQVGGRAIWILPCSFVALMVGGGLLNLARVSVPLVEQGIMASVLVLGLIIAFAAKLPIAASALLVGLFATFHGYAHVAEMSTDHSPVPYAMGFVLATAMLHGIGIGSGLAARRFISAQAIRWCGAAIAACGVLLMLHVLEA